MGGASTNLAQLLMRAFYWIDESLQNTIKDRGWPNISRAQSMVFVNIGEGVTRPSDIAGKLGVSRQAIHQTINELITMGLVNLVPDPEDRRAKIVVFTAQGLVLGKDAILALQQAERLLADRIGAEVVSAMRNALEQEWGKPLMSKSLEQV